MRQQFGGPRLRASAVSGNKRVKKRIAGDYEIFGSVRIGEQEIILGISPEAAGEERFLCAVCRAEETVPRYEDIAVSGDAAEILALFGERIKTMAIKRRLKRG